MAYKHGVYGVRTASQAKSAPQTEEVILYVGTAPVNLVRDFADKDLVNTPIMLTNLNDAYDIIGYSENWDDYSLNEVVDYHFNNTNHNIGPIYVINVLDPGTHKKSAQTTKELTFVAGKASFTSTTIILDTFAIAGKVEGTDYTLSYDMASGTVLIDSSRASTPLDGDVEVAYYEVDSSLITPADIIGTVGSDGTVTGLQAIKLIYQQFNVVVSLLAIPGFSEIPAVYKAMITAAQKINNHWDAFVLADIPLTYDVVSYDEVTPVGTENPKTEGWYVLSSGEYVLTTDESVQGGTDYYEKVVTTTAVDTIAKAKAWQANNGYTEETSKVFWPKAQNGDKVYHLSTAAAAEMLYLDESNDCIPYMSASNHAIMATKQYFGASVSNPGFDDQEANELNQVGITTMAFWDGEWKLWGGHTAAYQYDTEMDGAVIFDTNIRMLMYLTNGFQLRHGTEIDTPLSLEAKERIRIDEQQELDILAARGALMGEPECEFIESENSRTDMVNGDFVWHLFVTPAPQMKSITGKVTYTDDGFQALYGEEG